MTKLTPKAAGTFAIAPTPFHEDGRIDEKSIDRLTDFYAEVGCDGVTVLGILGEAPKLDASEAEQVAIRFVKRAKNLQIIVGVSAPGFAAMRSLALPAGLRATFQGSAAAFQDTLRTQPYLIGAALLAVYIVLGLLYESFIHPLTILSTLPSAGAGALLALLLTGNELSVIGLIGILLLIGIVKKNGIMMVDFALSAERERGIAPEAAIVEACLLRFRPILMTTSCAILAGTPLMLGQGTGSELRRPLGLAMVGGLLLSQLLTLFTTPVVYLYLDRLALRLQRRPAAGAEPTVSS